MNARRGLPTTVSWLLLAVGIAASAAAADPRDFQAGAAIGDITPELGSMIIGGFSPTPAKDVHDPLIPYS